ncbi:hypothetical protein L249_2316 [Ophiocordyceps polyrhachis-furcata BCC 54312]|uniref:CHL4 family chromosome segregation protein n=1 Tax=Ophiocordyceps polyrhachis-furcata BCC 54312 TaxID=1330021 RepID=A0A367LNN4_9HYPO|nr:hypothetical protein L249_2316 [Ophiocordyceps polyrhachis-furcata BCC 54312]
MARLSVPTKARLPSSLRVEPTNRAVVKSLGRLSREALLSIALDWLDDDNLPNAAPYLVREADADEDDPDHLYPPCRSIAELRDLYRDMQSQKGSKRDVVSRILEGDWRHGLTLYQLAMIDCAHLEEHPTSHNWSAYAILPLKLPSAETVDEEEQLKPDKRSLTIPRFHPSTFLQKLQDQVLPDVKAHYHFYRPRDYPVLLLRVFVIDSPYNTSLALSAQHAAGTTNFASSRTIYLAFPDGSPSLYITRSQSTGPISLGESKSLHGLVVNGVPKALSQRRQRFVLRSTNLSSRNLYALLDRRGGGRGNAAAGGWSIYADERIRESPLDTIPPCRPLLADSEADDVAGTKRPATSELSRELKRARLVAKARFANEALVTDGKGVERVDILMQDPFPVDDGDGTINDDGGGGGGGGLPADPDATVEDKEDAARQRAPDRRRSRLDVMLRQARADEGDGGDEADASRWTPAVRLSFQGAHVFAGIRQLVEAGVVDGERMPGWMTGEEGVTTGVVRHGRVRGYRGAGL